MLVRVSTVRHSPRCPDPRRTAGSLAAAWCAPNGGKSSLDRASGGVREYRWWCSSYRDHWDHNTEFVWSPQRLVRTSSFLPLSTATSRRACAEALRSWCDHGRLIPAAAWYLQEWVLQGRYKEECYVHHHERYERRERYVPKLSARLASASCSNRNCVVSRCPPTCVMAIV
jgi:hypothetical protein